MSNNNISPLADYLFDIKRDTSAMREGKRKIESLFLLMKNIIKPGMSFDNIKSICENRLMPYEDVIVQIIPENLPYHNEITDFVVIEGQLLTIDCAVKIKREWADGAFTLAVGEIDALRKYLLNCSKELFHLVRKMSQPNNAFINTVKKTDNFIGLSECFLVSGCGGHGIGRSLHQGNDYIYSDFHTSLIYPCNESYTVEPVIGMNIKGQNIYSYFEETIIN